jgi:hypothetical protein
MVRSHTIEPKGIINPCNEVDVRAYGFMRVFLCLTNNKWQKTRKVFYCTWT